MTKQSYIDSQEHALRIEEGDSVHILNERSGKPSKWIGLVTAVVDSIGMVDVETPFGNQRYRAEVVLPAEGAPNYTDTSYESYDNRESKIAARYVDRLSEGAAQTAVRVLEATGDPVRTYDILFREASGRLSDHEARTAVRIAMYWKERGRQYIPTQQEEEEGIYHCPKCKEELVKANYKKHTRLLACPECMFLIRPEDIVDRSKPDDEGDLEETVKLPSGQQDLADAIWEKAKSAGMSQRLRKMAEANPEAAREVAELLCLVK